MSGIIIWRCDRLLAAVRSALFFSASNSICTNLEIIEMASEESPTNQANVIVKWSGKEYTIKDISNDATVAQLKERVFKETGVKPERQKLLGLKCKGRWKP